MDVRILVGRLAVGRAAGETKRQDRENEMAGTREQQRTVVRSDTFLVMDFSPA